MWISVKIFVVAALLRLNEFSDGKQLADRNNVGFLDDIACSPDSQPRELTDFSGWFASPNYPQDYPNSANCQWLIRSQTRTISLNFLLFDTERKYDKLVIHDGASTSSNVLAEFDGTFPNPPSRIHGSGSDILVVFTSDYSISHPGFNATYISSDTDLEPDACFPLTRPLVLSDYSGSFSSDGFPTSYWNNINCQWLIASQEPSGIVEISFDTFRTETRFDRVRIYDGNSSSAPLIGALDGDLSTGSTTIQSSQPFLFVEFTSDFTIVDAGFSGSYRSLPQPSTTTSSTAPTTVTPFPPGPCGTNLRVSPSEATIPPSHNIQCYLNRTDVDYLNTNCYDLVQNLPGIGNADSLLQQGGNFGCFLTGKDDFSDAPLACYDGYQWFARLGNCESCTRLLVCIRFQ